MAERWAGEQLVGHRLPSGLHWWSPAPYRHADCPMSFPLEVCNINQSPAQPQSESSHVIAPTECPAHYFLQPKEEFPPDWGEQWENRGERKTSEPLNWGAHWGDGGPWWCWSWLTLPGLHLSVKSRWQPKNDPSKECAVFPL